MTEEKINVGVFDVSLGTRGEIEIRDDTYQFVSVPKEQVYTLIAALITLTGEFEWNADDVDEAIRAQLYRWQGSDE